MVKTDIVVGLFLMLFVVPYFIESDIQRAFDAELPVEGVVDVGGQNVLLSVLDVDISVSVFNSSFVEGEIVYTVDGSVGFGRAFVSSMLGLSWSGFSLRELNVLGCSFASFSEVEGEILRSGGEGLCALHYGLEEVIGSVLVPY